MDILGNRLINKLSILLVIGLTAVFFIYGILSNWHELARYQWQPDYSSLFYAFVIYSIGLGFTSLCWHSVVRQLGVTTSLFKNLKFYYQTNLVKRIPTPLWYATSRMQIYSQEGVLKRVSGTAVLVEIIITIFSGMLIYLLSLPFSPYLPSLNEEAWLVLLLLVPLIVIILFPQSLNFWLSYLLSKLRRGELAIVIKPINMLKWSTLYAFAWISGGGIIYFLANGLHPLPWAYLPAMINIWTASGIVGLLASLLPAGLWLKEVTLAYLLSYYMPLPIAILVSLLSRFLLMLIDLFWALIFSVSKFLFIRLQEIEKSGRTWVTKR